MKRVPVYRGAERRKDLYRRWGLPNGNPREGESFFGACRLTFIDDDTGEVVAHWVPSIFPRNATTQPAPLSPPQPAGG